MFLKVRFSENFAFAGVMLDATHDGGLLLMELAFCYPPCVVKDHTNHRLSYSDVHCPNL